MKVGIVGLGKMGLLHTSILNTIQDVNITSITEKEKFVKKYVQNAVKNVNFYDNYHEMLITGGIPFFISQKVRFRKENLLKLAFELCVIIILYQPIKKNWSNAWMQSMSKTMVTSHYTMCHAFGIQYRSSLW